MSKPNIAPVLSITNTEPAFISSNKSHYDRFSAIIQKKFLYGRFINQLEATQQLISDLNKTNNTFESLQKLLINKNNIKTINLLLNKLYRVIKIRPEIAFQINCRELLCAWMIVLFPETILSKEKSTIIDDNTYPNDIYHVANNFINKLELLIKNPYNLNVKRLFIKHFNQYSNAITYFLERDKKEKLYRLIKEYYDITATLITVSDSKKYDNMTKEECLNEIKKSRSIIFKNIKQLDNSIDENNLASYATIEYLREKRLNELQYDILRNDIRDKKFMFFNMIIEDIKSRLIKLNAHKKINKDGTPLFMENLLNSDELIRKITYSTISTLDITKFGEYLKNIINELQAPIAVTETNEIWNEIFTIYSIKSTEEYIAKILHFILDEIYKIYQTIKSIATLDAVGINVFEMK